jgi:hypothetical protein
MIHVSAILDKELAESPVSVEGGSIEAKVLSERLKGFAVFEQKSYRTDIAIISAPFDERYASFVYGIRGIPLGKIFKDQIGASICDSIKHNSPFKFARGTKDLASPERRPARSRHSSNRKRFEPDAAKHLSSAAGDGRKPASVGWSEGLGRSVPQAVFH